MTDIELDGAQEATVSMPMTQSMNKWTTPADRSLASVYGGRSQVVKPGALLLGQSSI